MNHRNPQRLLLIPLVLILAACSGWPAVGGGGTAETFGPRPECVPIRDHATAHALDHRLGCALDRLAGLRLVGAAVVVPGLVQRAQIQADRTVRELTGRLYGDAQYDLEILGAQLDEIERYLVASLREPEVVQAAVAVSAGRDDTLARLAARLECHAQFASDSSELDPRFAALLGELGASLRERPEVTVQVTGHTDDVGSEAYNHGLAGRRAEAVRTVLSHAGVAVSRIEVVAAGETARLFETVTPAARLANRRVEVLLSKPEGALQSAAYCPLPPTVPAT